MEMIFFRMYGIEYNVDSIEWKIDFARSLFIQTCFFCLQNVHASGVASSLRFVLSSSSYLQTFSLSLSMQQLLLQICVISFDPLNFQFVICKQAWHKKDE